MDIKPVIVEPHAPDRCQAVASQGQCKFQVVAGARHCIMHGGSATLAHKARQDQRKYKLAKWQDRVNDFADDAHLKNLNEEIAILRMTLEQVVLACTSGGDMLLYAPKIGDLVAKIEKLVVTCLKIEMASGVVLSKRAAFDLAARIVDIVGAHVTDPEAVARIADEIGTAIANVKGDDADI